MSLAVPGLHAVQVRHLPCHLLPTLATATAGLSGAKNPGQGPAVQAVPSLPVPVWGTAGVGRAGEDAPLPCSAHPTPPVLSMPAGLSHFHHAGLSCSFPTATRAGPFLLVSLPAALTRSGCCPPVRL